jgi:hypothetical protein
MAFEGSCHCGAVRFTVDAALPDSEIACNCSHCSRKGFLLSFFPRDTFTLDSGEGDLQEYLFNTHRIAHQFCTTCGTEAFAWGTGPSGEQMAAVNLRCVPAVDTGALHIQAVDGASR